MTITAATFVLGIGDLLAIISPIVTGSGYIIYRMTKIPMQIRASRDEHEDRCENHAPVSSAKASARMGAMR